MGLLCTVCIVSGEFTYVLRVSSGSFLVIIPVSGSTVVKIHLHSKYTPERFVTRHTAISKYIRDQCVMNGILQNPRKILVARYELIVKICDAFENIEFSFLLRPSS